MVCLNCSFATLAGHKEKRNRGYTSFLFYLFFTGLFFTELRMIGAQQQDVYEEQYDEVKDYGEPENDLEALLAAVDFQQPQLEMGGQQRDVQIYQGQQFGGVNYDRDFQQQPQRPRIQTQYSGYGAYPQADFVGRDMRYSPYGDRGGIGNGDNRGVSLAQVLSRTQAEARRDPFMLGGFRQAGAGETFFGPQRQQPVPQSSQNY